MKSSKGSRKAGYSAQAHFRARRRRVLRENMRDWLLTVAFGAGCVAGAVLVQDRIAALILAGVAGAVVMFGVIGWVVGDVYSLPWMWGAIGERQTADALKGLDDSWRCEHDIQRPRGNSDHVRRRQVSSGRREPVRCARKSCRLPALGPTGRLRVGRLPAAPDQRRVAPQASRRSSTSSSTKASRSAPETRVTSVPSGSCTT
jgi:hypothetical protein